MTNKASDKESEKGNSTSKKIAVALQGGGAHGAFAWGVLDKILEDGRFDIRGVSGTSAGGMNAASTIMGLLKGGPEVARATLKDYWRSMSELSKKISPYAMSPMDKLMGNFNLDHSIGYSFMSLLQSQLSPYDMNPSNHNPFEDFIRGFFDFKLLRSHTERRIFLGATHVKTGKVKMFTNEDMSADVMMASACLPFLFQAARVDDEYYWDGGFIANPGIFPLIDKTDAQDIVLVQLTKTHCEELPKTKAKIMERFREITFNGCLVREMRAIHFVTKLIDDGLVAPGKLKRINMHVIKNEDAFKKLNLSSALNTDWDFLQTLFESGRKTAHDWIKSHFDKIGKKTSVDEEMFADFV